MQLLETLYARINVPRDVLRQTKGSKVYLAVSRDDGRKCQILTTLTLEAICEFNSLLRTEMLTRQ